MNRLVAWLEDYVLPIATRLGQVRWLVALKNAFISIIPITIAGSLAVLIKSLVEIARDQLGLKGLAFLLKPLLSISMIVWRGSFALFALFLAVALGYQLSKTFETNRLAGAIISVASFMMSVANVVKVDVAGKSLLAKNAFDISQFSTSGIFTAILFGSLGFAVYALCYKGRIMLHLQANYPHAEMVALDSLLPGIIAIFTVGSINYLFQLLTGTYFGNWLLHSIQMPLIKMGQGFGMVMLVTILIQIFWFFGLNGLGVMAPILDSIWLTAQNVNVTLVKAGKIPSMLWARGSFDVFAWFGGTGGTLILIMGILAFSKRNETRTMAKVALAPSFFNIGEPIVFGLPVVLNPVYFIPFVLAPAVNVAFAYWMTVMGLVNPVQVAVPSFMPPLLGAFLACNYDWRAILVCLINMALAFLIWMPFIFAADKIENANGERSPFAREY